MIIAGLQKMTLLDYPGHLACTVFLKGCNFRCPFCYNSSLVINEDSSNEISEQEFFDFLIKRKGKLDGVAITGGEPLLSKDIIPFIEKIKNLGFKVKLDTNGTSNKLLQYLIDNKLVDYVAMDIKNSFKKYNLTTNCQCDEKSIKKSIEILLQGKVDYEFRTTVVKEFHDTSDFIDISNMIKGAKKYFIQSYLYKDSVFDKSLSAHSKEKLEEFKKIVEKTVDNVFIRGVE